MIIDIANQQFGKLTTVQFLGKQIYRCSCSCGGGKDVKKKDLTSGRVKSCGCIRESKRLKLNIGDAHDLLTITELFYNNVRLCCKCDCKCGNSTIISGSSFKITKSCGCLKHKHKANMTDLCNRKFGMLTVLSFSHLSERKSYWNCLCDCGNEIIVWRQLLVHGSKKTCGNHKKQGKIRDLTGQKFGTLTAIKMEKTENGVTTWMFRCDCGNDKILPMGNVTFGAIRSCGCITNQLKQETCMKNYGVKSPMQSAEIALRAAKTSNKSVSLYNWATDAEVICTASYEVVIVDGYLNAQRLIYLWQPETFETPFLTKTGKISTYRPDACLFDPATGLWTWVEIKGYMREDARKKWEWFHSTHPNSVLWDRDKLMEMGLIT